VRASAPKPRIGVLLPLTQTFATTLVIVVLGLLSGIELARALGPLGRGQVAGALLWPGLLTYLGAIGLGQAVVVFTAAQNNQEVNSTIFSTAACLGLALSIFAMAAGFFMLPALLRSQSAEVIRASRVFLLTIPGGILSGFITSCLQGRCSFLKLNFVRLIIPVGYVLGLATLIIFHRISLMSVVLVQLTLSYLTLLLGYMILFTEGIYFSARNAKTRVARELLAFGSKAYLGILSGTLNQRLDQALLAAFFPAAQLGIYSVAVSTAGATDSISFAFRTVASGRIAQKRLLAEKQVELRRMLVRFFPILLAGAAALAALLPKLVPFVYGSEFRSAIVPAEVLLIAQVCYAAKNLLTSAAEAFGDSWLGSKAELIGLGPNILLLVILLPRLGIVGAALASVFAYSIQAGVIGWGFARKRWPEHSLTEQSDIHPQCC
jgi:O-antigen/teichoic acid export membrane protein